MEIFTPNTGDEQMDKAYINMQMHISSFDDFNQFFNYFQKIVKSTDQEKINKWLLKVLFVEMKYKIHDFDKFLSLLDDKNRKAHEEWLQNKIKEYGGQ